MPFFWSESVLVFAKECASAEGLFYFYGYLTTDLQFSSDIMSWTSQLSVVIVNYWQQSCVKIINKVSGFNRL